MIASIAKQGQCGDTCFHMKGFQGVQHPGEHQMSGSLNTAFRKCFQDDSIGAQGIGMAININHMIMLLSHSQI